MPIWIVGVVAIIILLRNVFKRKPDLNLQERWVYLALNRRYAKVQPKVAPRKILNPLTKHDSDFESYYYQTKHEVGLKTWTIMTLKNVIQKQ